ncbi:pre-mRNA-splicing factor syf2-like [Dysidea avara]|uniref:pre-mRNA-splicing factor syf2-like n=1 Tax=Dysidea avara TaxID=196820 RepID=UPI00332777CD
MATSELPLEDEVGTEETEDDTQDDAQESDEDTPEIDNETVEPKPTSKTDKLKQKLRRLREEAKKLNHQAVVEEDKRMKLPPNYEAVQRKVEWETAEEEAKKKAEEDGEDYDRVKLWDKGADELERLQKKRKKKNPDEGFSDYEQATFRQYQRLTKQLKPDIESYERQKEELGQDFFPTSSSLLIGKAEKTVSKSGVDRMVQDLHSQIDKRSKYSRRREFQHDADVDYINERNMRFNRKTARFYDKYTAEIKQNLERGTAL